jgi:hypothetical protein
MFRFLLTYYRILNITILMLGGRMPPLGSLESPPAWVRGWDEDLATYFERDLNQVAQIVSRKKISSRVKAMLFFISGFILIGFSAWCLLLAVRFGLWTIRLYPTPFDMRLVFFVSAGINLGLFSLLFSVGILSIYIGTKVENIVIQAAFRLSLPKLVLLAALIALSILALSDYRYTTKVTVEEKRGAPVSFLTVGELRVFCLTDIVFWKCRHVEELQSLPLLANMGIFYYCICLIVHGWQMLTASAKIRLPDRPYRL